MRRVLESKVSLEGWILLEVVRSGWKLFDTVGAPYMGRATNSANQLQGQELSILNFPFSILNY